MIRTYPLGVRERRLRSLSYTTRLPAAWHCLDTIPATLGDDTHLTLGCVLEPRIVTNLLQAFFSLLPPDLLLLKGKEAIKETSLGGPKAGLS